MIKLLSGNEALALGAYHSGVKVATAYPGTPSTEILEAIATHEDIYAEWSTNEKVAMEVALGAAYSGVRAMVSMKHVGLNVASDAFMAASMTGVNAGLVIVNADDPGIHSSQSEQDNRHYVKLAKVPMLEPADSQEAYELMSYAFAISEKFDTPVVVRTTTRISHSKSLVRLGNGQVEDVPRRRFEHNWQKYVLLPVCARLRHPVVEERILNLAEYAETFPLNKIIWNERQLGIVTSGVAYQYAREVFPKASLLKLGMTYPLPHRMLREFASRVDRLIVIEELDPFLEENIKSLDIQVTGKEFIPRIGELTVGIIEMAGRSAGLLADAPPRKSINIPLELPKRPPLLCPGCPHTGIFFVLNTIGKRSQPVKNKTDDPKKPDLIICGDIGCYTLASYPPLQSMDTTACMGASIGMALGMEKAGSTDNIVAVIGDSTFLHAGITGLVNAVYNQGKITVIILDNGTTAMTGHQEHPGTGISAQGKESGKVDLEQLVRGIGIRDVTMIDAFNVKALLKGVRGAISRPELSVIIVRGACPLNVPRHANPRVIDQEKCDLCNTCLRFGCSAIQKVDERIIIDTELCVGDACAVCEQLCPQQAIAPQSNTAGKVVK